MRLFPILHVVIFANVYPDVCTLSQDKWGIIEITEGNMAGIPSPLQYNCADIREDIQHMEDLHPDISQELTPGSEMELE